MDINLARPCAALRQRAGGPAAPTNEQLTDGRLWSPTNAWPQVAGRRDLAAGITLGGKQQPAGNGIPGSLQNGPLDLSTDLRWVAPGLKLIVFILDMCGKGGGAAASQQVRQAGGAGDVCVGGWHR